MAATAGQPAPKPGSLKGPVGVENQADEVDALLADIPAAPSMEPQDDEVSQLLADVPDESAPPAQASVDDVPTVTDESLMGRYSRIGNIPQTAKEVVGDTVARFQASWGVTDAEKVGKLKEIYGPKGVRQAQDGTIQIKRPGEAGFRDFDPDSGLFSLDIINDIADFGRDAVEGGVVVADRILSARGKKGAPMSGGRLAMGAAAGAADAVISLNVGDWIAENLVGIKRDPTRDGAKESAIAGGLGAGFATGFGLAASSLARRRIAAEARKSTVAASEVRQIADDVAQSADSLERNGIKISNGKMVLSPGQITGDLSPEAKTLDFDLSTEGPVRNFFVEQGKLIGSAFDTMKQGFVNTTGKPAEELFQSVKKAAKATRELEGKTIGTFRNEALKVSQNAPRPMQKTAEGLNDFLTEFGFDRVGGKLRAPTLEQIKERFPDANEAVLGKVRSLATDLNGIMIKNNGAVPLKDVDRLYSGFRDTIDNFMGTSSGDGVARKLIDIKNRLRDDWAVHIGAELSERAPGSLEAYQASMKKYSDILSAQDTLSRILKKKDLSSAAFANHIFNPAQGKERVGQLKTLIQASDPRLWDDLVSQHVDLLHKEALDPKTGRTNWLKLSQKFDKLEKSEVLDQMLDPAQKANMKNFFTIAKKVDSKFNFKEGAPVDKSMVSTVRNLLITAAAPVSFIARLSSGQQLTQSMIDSIGKDKALAKWLNGEGLELVLKGVPPKEAGRLRKFMMGALKGTGATLQARTRRSIAADPRIPEALRAEETEE